MTDTTRYLRFFASALLGMVVVLNTVEATAPPKQKQPLNVNQTLEKIQQQQKQLAARRAQVAEQLQRARDDGAEDLVADLLQWQSLAEELVVPQKTVDALDKKVQQAKERLQSDSPDRALQLLHAAEEELNQLTDDLELLTQTVEAENRAEQTHKDSKMYFKMRVRSEIPPKVLKAYGMMELAKQERDKGRFAEALELWQQAETMVREGFSEHVALMAEWREQAKRDAEQKRQRIKTQAEALLKAHFVTIPAGEFMMGDDEGSADERPAHKVNVPAFKLGQTEVTFELYDLCVENNGCYSRPDDEGWGRGDRPVVNVSYYDITQRFLPWLNKLTGKNYRLPSEAEWEYAARAGSENDFAWGNNLTCDKARYDGGPTSVCNTSTDNNRGTVAVKSFEPNAWGLYDMHGNAWEWVEDCWSSSYKEAPQDGTARTSGNCGARVLRGGSWDYHKGGARLANRYFAPYKTRKPSFGFRLAVDE